MQTHLPCRTLVTFDHTGFNTHPDCTEISSNLGLYLLRSACGVTLHKSTNPNLTVIIQSTDSVALRIFAGLLALTLFLPFTLIGLALECLSKSHSETYRMVQNLQLPPKPTQTAPVPSPTASPADKPSEQKEPTTTEQRSELITNPPSSSAPTEPAPTEPPSTNEVLTVAATPSTALTSPAPVSSVDPATAIVADATTPASPILTTATTVAETAAAQFKGSVPANRDQPSAVTETSPPSSPTSPPKLDHIDTLLTNGDMDAVERFIKGHTKRPQREKVCSQLVQRANAFIQKFPHIEESKFKNIYNAVVRAFYQMPAALFCEHAHWILDPKRVTKPKNFDMRTKIDINMCTVVQLILTKILGKEATEPDPKLLTSPLYINEQITHAISKNLGVSFTPLNSSTQIPPSIAGDNAYAMRLPPGREMISAYACDSNGRVAGTLDPVALPTHKPSTETQLVPGPAASRTMHTVTVDPTKISPAFDLLATGNLAEISKYINQNPDPTTIDKACEELANAAFLWAMRPTGRWIRGERALTAKEEDNLIKAMEFVFFNMSGFQYMTFIHMIVEPNCPDIHPRLRDLTIEINMAANNVPTNSQQTHRLLRDQATTGIITLGVMEISRKADPMKLSKEDGPVFEALLKHLPEVQAKFKMLFSGKRSPEKSQDDSIISTLEN